MSLFRDISLMAHFGLYGLDRFQDSPAAEAAFLAEFCTWVVRPPSAPDGRSASPASSSHRRLREDLDSLRSLVSTCKGDEG